MNFAASTIQIHILQLRVSYGKVSGSSSDRGLAIHDILFKKNRLLYLSFSKSFKEL